MSYEFIKLKPCPFCGNHPVIGTNGISFWVECKGCGVYISRSTKEEAIGMWNTRFDEINEVDDEAGMSGMKPGTID